jgi:glycosyltransferase involved in cell wall biosynthesis
LCFVFREVYDCSCKETVTLTAIILTLNEEKHLERCLKSILSVADRIVVVDCFSADSTVDIAKAHGAEVLQNPWVNYATQFNWALAQLDASAGWILRIDADEVLSPRLAIDIKTKINSLDTSISGVYLNRRMTFLGKPIKYGGVFPVQVLRLFRYGHGECENRWMDEHIKVTGATTSFQGDLIDDNLNSLTWWTDKHNKYASREAVDLLNVEYGFMPHDSVASLRDGSQAGIKRWIKERLYARLPLGLRAFAYFLYRYIFRLGFLDGQAGAAFHFLQGFWYRHLVDAKVAEVKRYMRDKGLSPRPAIKDVLGIEVSRDG